jgi:hypothetical protein
MSVAFRDYIYEVEEYGAPLEELPALREELEKMWQEAEEYYRNYPVEPTHYDPNAPDSLPF